jgi:tetratricopeptide (TPR) repeat protein
MPIDRLAMLQQAVVRTPDDAFPRYGLAMELRKLGRGPEACVAFAELLERHAGYVAAYLMYGNLLRDQGELEQAKTIYERGAEVALAAGNEHAHGELVSARAELT